MKKRNWYFVILWATVMVLSIVIPGIITDTCHGLAGRIRRVQETETDEESGSEKTDGTESEKRQTERLPAKTPAGGSEDPDERSGLSETETVTEKEKVLYQEGKEGYAKKFLGEKEAAFRTTAELYLQGITGQTCRLNCVTFLEPYGESGYRTELVYETEDGFTHEENLICEYDTVYQFYRIYPEGIEEEN